MPNIRRKQGKLYIIVGPSGSGKDTIINGLKQRLGYNKQIIFVKRVVTRKADSNSEDHVSMSEADFSKAKTAGKFAVTWEAHGLHYAIPTDVVKHIEMGGIAIANGSRRALDDIVAIFPSLAVINIVVDRETLRKRLLARGRESETEIRKRLDHASIPLQAIFNAIDIENSGPVENAIEHFLGILTKASELQTA